MKTHTGGAVPIMNQYDTFRNGSLFAGNTVFFKDRPLLVFSSLYCVCLALVSIIYDIVTQMTLSYCIIETDNPYHIILELVLCDYN